MDEGNLEDVSTRHSKMAQILAVCIKNTLLLTLGISLGYPTLLIPGLGEFNADVSLTSWIGSISLICVPVGGAISGMVTQAFGRKRTMQIVNIPFLCAWLFFAFATDTTHLIIALCITGVTGGLLEAPVITYVAEVCQPELRGILSSTSTLSVTGGVLIEFFLGTMLTWRHVALANCFFPILSFILLFFVPESPHWLILKERYEEAKKSVAWLRGWTDVKNVEVEYNELKLHIDKEDTKQSIRDKFKLFFKKNFLWPFSLIGLIFFLCHFSGMSTLQTFSVQIFASVKSPINEFVATLIVGIAELVGCVFSVGLIHKFGKRLLNFISLIGCSLCFVSVATYVYLIDVTDLPLSNTTTNSTQQMNESNTYNWIPLTLLIMAAFFSHLGIRILPWILTGELFSTETRAAGSGFSSAIGYVFDFVANNTFLYMVKGITLAGTFWFNGAVGLIGCILLYIWLPETEGKSLHEIVDHYSGRTKLDNLVRKKTHGQNSNGFVNNAFSLEERNNTSLKLTISRP